MSQSGHNLPLTQWPLAAGRAVGAHPLWEKQGLGHSIMANELHVYLSDDITARQGQAERAAALVHA